MMLLAAKVLLTLAVVCGLGGMLMLALIFLGDSDRDWEARDR